VSCASASGCKSLPGNGAQAGAQAQGDRRHRSRRHRESSGPPASVAVPEGTAADGGAARRPDRRAGGVAQTCGRASAWFAAAPDGPGRQAHEEGADRSPRSTSWASTSSLPAISPGGGVPGRRGPDPGARPRGRLASAGCQNTRPWSSQMTTATETDRHGRNYRRRPSPAMGHFRHRVTVPSNSIPSTGSVGEPRQRVSSCPWTRPYTGCCRPRQAPQAIAGNGAFAVNVLGRAPAARSATFARRGLAAA